MILRLNSSQLSKMDTCGRAYKFYYRDGLESIVRSVSLIFGDSIHKSITGWLEARALGKPVPMMVDSFAAEFRTQVRSLTVSYPDKWTEQDFLDCGAMLLPRFQEWWDHSGYMPLVTPEGVWIERPLSAFFGQPGIVPGFPNVQIELYGTPDIIALSPAGKPVLLDFKTTASSYPETFLENSDQLRMYQLLVQANEKLLGFSELEGAGFIPLVRRKAPTRSGVGPAVEALPPRPARSQSDLEEFKQKILWAAEDILRQRFSRKSHSAFNTPCAMCEYAGLCIKGDKTGLRQKQNEALPIAA